MTGEVAAAASRARGRPLVQRLARGSLAARGAVYLVLAYLTARLAVGLPSRHADSSQGALTGLVQEPAGRELVALLALGFVVYAAWRLLQAAGQPGTGGSGLAQRVGWVGIALAYLALAAEAVQAAAQGRASHGNPASEAARVLQLPGGRVLLFAVGIGVVVGGIGLAMWAALQRFEICLPDGGMPGWAEPTARITGTFGNVVRGGAFAAVGVTLAAAAVAGRSRDAKGLGAALATLVHQPFGRPLLAVVALGFAAFAVISGLEARYRDV